MTKVAPEKYDWESGRGGGGMEHDIIHYPLATNQRWKLGRLVEFMRDPSRLLTTLCMAFICTTFIFQCYRHQSIKAENVDPCENFYEFACGHRHRETYYHMNSDTMYTTQGIDILTSLKPENSAEEKAQNFYKSCVKAGTSFGPVAAHEKLAEMLEKLEKIPQGNLQQKLQLVQNEYGFSPFFSWRVESDWNNPRENIIHLAPKDPTIFDKHASGSSEYFMNYLDNSDKLKRLMAETLVDRLKLNDFKPLIKLEKEIQELVDSSPHNPEPDVVTVTQLQNLTGFINWKKFFNNGFKEVNVTIYSSEKVSVCSLEFFSKLSKKLELLQNSPGGAKLLNNYLILDTGKALIQNLLIPGEFSSHSVITDFHNWTDLTMSMCSAITQQAFESAVASMYRRQFLKQYPDLETKTMEPVRKMMENIRAELILLLKEAKWLDKKSRENAITKAQKTKVLIGLPENVKNSVLLEQLYDFCPKMNDSDYVGNVMSYLKADRRENLLIFKRPVEKKDGLIALPLAAPMMDNNAYAWANLNFIFLPIRNLFQPNFSPKVSDSVNYANVGLTIGHEFLHGFSQFGLSWGGDEEFMSQNSNQSLWHTQETREKVEERSKCFIQQYNKFSYSDGTFLNGNHTLMENFADNGGLEVATRALFRLLDKKNRNMGIKSMRSRNKTYFQYNKEKLDRSEFSDAQQFFVSFAQSFCTNAPLKFSTDSHSHDIFRVLGSLQNSKAFSDAFNCPLNSRMNPQEKCTVF